jgi:hypothetical protein
MPKDFDWSKVSCIDCGKKATKNDVFPRVGASRCQRCKMQWRRARARGATEHEWSTEADGVAQCLRCGVYRQRPVLAANPCHYATTPEVREAWSPVMPPCRSSS